MFKPFKSLGLWFENCEYYVLPAEYIQAYEFLNVHTDLFTNHEYQTCDGFAMTIHREANQTNWKDAGTGQYVADLFARLEDRDLYSITVTYSLPHGNFMINHFNPSVKFSDREECNESVRKTPGGAECHAQ